MMYLISVTRAVCSGTARARKMPFSQSAHIPSSLVRANCHFEPNKSARRIELMYKLTAIDLFQYLHPGHRPDVFSLGTHRRRQ